MQTVKNIFLFSLVLVVLALVSCQSSSNQYTYIEEGLDKVIKTNLNTSNYTIILADMDYANDKYIHKYQIITEEEGAELKQNTTDWMEVSPVFFQQHENDLGMELASKKDGKLTKAVAPPGYSQYVGNEQYGEWRQESNGTSFWHFYGQYAFMSMMFHSMMPRRSSWDTYNRDYRGNSKPYYGSGGSSYGTKSVVNSGKSTASWSKKPSSFRDKVRTQVKQSASATKARRAPSSKTSPSKPSRRKMPRRTRGFRRR